MLTLVKMFIELLPMHECTLLRNAGCVRDVVGRIFQDIVQMGAQGSGALRQHNAQLGEQSSNAVNACCALLFEPFTQPMHTQYALLLWSLHGYKAHLRATGCLTNGSRIIGIVLPLLPCKR